MKIQDKFNCVLPVEFEKAVDKTTGETNYKFRAIASDESEDSDKEVLNPKGFEFSQFVDYGFVNYNHLAKSSPLAVIGEPTSAFVNDKNQFVVDGILYGSSKLTQEVIKTIDILEKSGSKRKFKLSIEGIPLQRNAVNPKRIEKARITGLAVTLSPKNANTLFSLVKGVQDQDYIDYEFEKAENPNGSDSPEFLFDITDKEKGVRVTMSKDLTIKIEKALTCDSPSGKAMRKESLEKKPKNMFEFNKAVVTIAEGYKQGLVSEKEKDNIVDFLEKARPHKYIRKEGNRYIYKENKNKGMNNSVYNEENFIKENPHWKGEEKHEGYKNAFEKWKEKKKVEEEWNSYNKKRQEEYNKMIEEDKKKYGKDFIPPM